MTTAKPPEEAGDSPDAAAKTEDIIVNAYPWIHRAYFLGLPLPWKQKGYSLKIVGLGWTQALSRKSVQAMIRSYLDINHEGPDGKYTVRVNFMPGPPSERL